MANDIEKAFRKHGGQLELGVKVEKILVEDGKCVGVVTADGDEIRANYVIYNGSPTVALAGMIEREQVPEEALKLTAQRELLGSPFLVYLGLDALPEEMGITSYEYFMGQDMDTERIYRESNEWAPHAKVSATCIDVAIPNMTGPDRCQLNFTTIYGPQAMHNNCPTKYQYLEQNEAFANCLIDYFERATGARIRDHIEEIAIATPATFTRYANAFRGNIYGYPCTAVDGAVTRMLRAEEERYIPGLDFVGSAGIRAHGYSSVITNGYDIAGVALEKLGGES